MRLHDALADLEYEAIDFTKTRTSSPPPSRWQLLDARRKLIRAAVKMTNAVARARKDRGR